MPNTTKGFPYPEGTALPDVPGDIQNLAQSIDTYLNNYAPLLSPTLSGIPAAPTANAGTNTTQIATTAFVSTAISNLISGAPGFLDTLDEIAQALNDDANFASTITTSLAGKEPTISSGTTGQYWRGDKTWQTLNNSAVGLGNVENTALSTWSGSSNITTIGTISTGMWQGSVIGSSYIDSDIARLSSPTFTGTPSAPTASVGTNTTQLATTAFVRTEITNLVASAPSALDTLNELATALGNDANFSTTVTNSLASKAPLASPSFTGTVSAESVTVSGTLDVQEIRETINDVTLSSNAGTFDWSTGNVFFIGTAPSGAMTFNFTNVPTDNGKIMSITIFVTQGSTGYIPSTININGSSATLRWVNGANPVPTSSAGKIDIFSFSLIRRASAWTVLGSSSLNF